MAKTSWIVKYQPLFLPAAILLGGLTVAVAVIFTGGLGRISSSADDTGNTVMEVEVSVDDDPVLGDQNAPVTIVELSDYQCPYCQSFWSETFPQLKSEYIDKGVVRFVYRDFPLTSIGHVSAAKSAEAANCAGDQGKYWEMQDKLFGGQQKDWGYYEESKKAYLPLKKALPFFGKYAQEIGLDVTAFNSCLSSSKFKEEVAKDLADVTALGQKLAEKYPQIFQGIGTPTFIIGKTDPSGTFTGQVLSGAYPFDSFQQIIDQLLK
jgi:protein-disulfide isomerase